MTELGWDRMVKGLAELSGTSEAVAAEALADRRPPGTDRERMVRAFSELANVSIEEAGALLAGVREAEAEPSTDGEPGPERVRELARQSGVSEGVARQFLAHLSEQEAPTSPGLARVRKNLGRGTR